MSASLEGDPDAGGGHLCWASTEHGSHRTNPLLLPGRCMASPPPALTRGKPTLERAGGGCGNPTECRASVEKTRLCRCSREPGHGRKGMWPGADRTLFAKTGQLWPLRGTPRVPPCHITYRENCNRYAHGGKQTRWQEVGDQLRLCLSCALAVTFETSWRPHQRPWPSFSSWRHQENLLTREIS